MICNTSCPYFPVFPNEIPWEADEFGIKHRVEKATYICGFDSHIITSWEKNVCPKEDKIKE